MDYLRTKRGFAIELFFKAVFLAVLPVVFSIEPSSAEEFYCEVLAVEGNVYFSSGSAGRRPLREQDLLKDGDTILTEKGATADITYDRECKNVVRVEEGSMAKIRSVVPMLVYLDHGGVYAKLKELPKRSTFSVETPTAVAAVRGTEYRTLVENGETEVFNVSDSEVYVFAVDESGHPKGEPQVLVREQMTGVGRPGEAPKSPRPMTEGQMARARLHGEGVERRVRQFQAEGRQGRIQDVRKMHDFIEKTSGEKKSLVSMENGERAGQGMSENTGKRLEQSKRLLSHMERAEKRDAGRERDVVASGDGQHAGVLDVPGQARRGGEDQLLRQKQEPSSHQHEAKGPHAGLLPGEKRDGGPNRSNPNAHKKQASSPARRSDAK